MKRLLLLIPICIFQFINAQPETIWTSFFGGSSDEYGECVQQTSDGGYIIIGRTHSYGNGSGDIWLIKTDSNGDSLWTRTFGGNDTEYGYSTQQTTDGGYILLGVTQSFGSGYYDFWLIKTDSTGNEEWNQTFGGTGYDQGYSVQQTSDGGYILTGNQQFNTSDGEQLLLIKTDSSGNTLWTKIYGSDGNDDGKSVQQTADGGYIIVGRKATSTNVGDGVWLLKTDSLGDTLWTKLYTATGDFGLTGSNGESVKQTTDGGYIIAGNIYENGDNNIWLIKTDSEGDALWTKSFGTFNSDEYGQDVEETSDGYIIAGNTSDAGYWDGILISVDSEGNQIWEKPYDYNMEDAIYSISITNDYGLIMAGYSWSGNSQVLLIKTSPVNLPIKINEIMQDPSAVADSDGEWFELCNYGDTVIDISGWIIKDYDGDSLMIPEEWTPEETPTIMPNDYFVLGVNGDSTDNGGVPVDLVYSRENFSLGNSDDEIIIYDQYGSEVDRVEYDGGINFPDPTGKSMELVYYGFDNSDGDNWLESTNMMYSGDYGTPGAGNSTLIPDMGIPFLDEFPNAYINFENTLIYDTSQITMLIENDGYGDLVITNISTGDTNSGYTVSVNSLIIHPQEDEGLVIYFSPDTAGFYNSELEFTTNDTSYATFSIDIQGLGLSPVREIFLSTDSIDFGEVGIGDSAVSTLLIYNMGNTGLEIDEISTDAPFYIDISDGSVEAAQQLDVEVRFVPQLIGVYPDTLIIISNDSDEEEVMVELFGTAVELAVDDRFIPTKFSLSQNYPNPFNPVTTILYQLPKSEFVNISIYNVVGQLVETLVNGHKDTGFHSVIWNANDIGSGLYFYRIEAGEYTETKKCIILK